MNPVIDLIKSHCSIRSYKDEPIDPQLFANIISAGQAASTSSFIQAVTVVRVRKKAVRGEFVTLSGNQKYIASAAEFLVFCADLQRNQSRVSKVQGPADYHWTEQFLATTVDVALMAQNIVIAAESAGLGCCYIGGIRNDPQKVTQLLRLPELVYPVFGLCIGVPDQQPGLKPRLPQAVVLHEDEYQQNDTQHTLIDDYDALIRNYYIARTGGKLEQTFSEQMAKQAINQTRPFIKKYLQKQGFMNK